MEKEMLVLGKFKSDEGKFEKFMGWMQSDEGMTKRKKIAHVEKTVASVTPDKSAVMFKISAHNEEALRKFVLVKTQLENPFTMNVLQVFKYGN